ncbi:ABC transporter permease [Candidatus Palauibacter soopunensis]|uniref:ABC transporter permease n=1 Tax=Candidatus Palauibacter soopunensis TaxID=3056739 RepID=UPI0023A3D6CE|nr:ABC transporter permease [Candidatus Palauibacter soopunensis]MDE2877721.1 ABC transporter permease [Candidatus Palauibacter soopunensis]
MLVFDLALKSLRNRAFSTSLTVSSIALSFALLIGVENVRVGMRESFSNTISQTDLIVGTKGGTIQLLLYSVFGMGAPTENVSWEAYREWAEHPAVEWTIPYSLGDSHRGFRVVGTNEDFYRHYRYRGGQEITLAEGRGNTDLFDVTLGADVAAELNYAMGDEISVTHGLGELGFVTHDHMPFTVVGIIDKTFTPVDRAIYVTLEGMEAIHWEDGVPPAPDDELAHDDEAEAAPADDGHAHDQEAEAAPADDGHAHAEDVSIEDVEVTQVTSFFVGTTDRRDVLQLQRDINDFEDEPMMAVLPGVALNEMWQGLGYAETGLRLVAIFVVLVGLLGMLVSLYTSLNERRREMAILRAVGAGPNRILALLVLESVCLAAAGALAGLAVVYGLLAAGQSIVEAQVGLFIPIRPPGPIELLLLGAVVTAGFLMGFVPAFKAYRTALHDGLAVRV